MEYIRKHYQKEENILDAYNANDKSCIIMPARHMDYDSIVMEDEATYCVRQTPINIIKHTCEEKDMTTFAGRKEVIAKRTGFSYKTPMLLHKEQMLLAFPTMAPGKFECAWIFLRESVQIHPHKEVSAITFNHGQTVMLDISYNILQSQLERTEMLAYAVQQSNEIY